MGNALRRRLEMTRFEGPLHEAMLNLLVASAHVRALLEHAFEGSGLTLGQYNVLRILRGAYPGGYARYEIARRLIVRAPDLTRMIDRLVKLGLVERARSAVDARHSLACITRRGLALLNRMRPDVDAVHRGLAKRLSAREARELSRLLERLYDEDASEK